MVFFICPHSSSVLKTGLYLISIKSLILTTRSSFFPRTRHLSSFFLKKVYILFWQSLTVGFRNGCLKIYTLIGIQHAITFPFFKMCFTLDRPSHLTGSCIFHHWDGTKTAHFLKLVSGKSRRIWMKVICKCYKFMLMWRAGLDRKVKVSFNIMRGISNAMDHTADFLFDLVWGQGIYCNLILSMKNTLCSLHAVSPHIVGRKTPFLWRRKRRGECTG